MPRDDDRATVGEVPAELQHAGLVVEKTIEYMLGEQVPALAIASALLGGSLGLMGRTMGDAAILKVLDNAAESVRSGALRRGEPPQQ